MPPRRTRKEIADWKEEPYRERPFVWAKVPRGLNDGKPYTVAKKIAERYEVKRFFASGGCGLLLAGRDVRTQTEVLIKATLNYDCTFDARARNKLSFDRRLLERRQLLQTERRIMVLLKNQGCNAIPNPNDYVFDWNPLLEGPYETHDKQLWKYTDEVMLASEPYLIMEAIEGKPLDALLADEWSGGLDERRALVILHQVTGVLALLHRSFTVGGKCWELVYRDLKPANVLLGDHDVATLIDLGGCRLTVDGKVAIQGAATAGYCAPECDSFGAQVTPATDSYTVGATLYHLITGQSPTGLVPPNASAGSRAVPFDRWNWASLQSKTRPASCQFIRGCLDARAANRPRDGGELHAAIGRLLS